MIGTLNTMPRLLMGALALILLSACIDPHAKPPVVDQDLLLHSLRFPYNHIYMAVGDTAIPEVYAIGVKADTLPFSRNDLQWSTTAGQLSIDSLGRIVALMPMMGGRIIVSLDVEGAQRRDTAYVYIYDSKLDVGSVKITPLDSAKRGLSYDNLFDLSMMDIRVWTADGLPLNEIVIEPKLQSSKPMGLSGIFPFGGGMYGVFPGSAIGPIWVKKSGWFFGQHLSDSALFVGLYPAQITITISKVVVTNALMFEAPVTWIQPCGKVEFTNNSDVDLEIEFESETSGIMCGGTQPASGSLHVSANTSIDRVISTAGEINWKAVRSSDHTDIVGLKGKLTVKSIEE